MLIAVFSQYFFGFTIFLSSLFLVLLVLVQRGRGGGLTGALGGPGGQSAFGTKAGDLFTRITVGVAAVWIFLCAAAVFFLKDRELPQTGVTGDATQAAVGSLNPSPSTALPGSGTSTLPSSGTTDSAAGSTMTAPAESGDAAPVSPKVDAEISDPAGLELNSPAAPAQSEASDKPAETPPATPAGE